MSQPSANAAGRIADRLAGANLLVTGATGFLAKIFLEKLLRSVDSVEGIYLLVRSRAGGLTSEKRVSRDVLRSRAFDRLRASLGEGFEELCRRKVHVIDGDLTRERMGLDEKAYAELTKKITLVVNSAATVTFDEQLDLAVQLNSLGPQRLLQFARDCGNVPFMHVSTCYVCGVRTGDVLEDFSAPEPARETLPRDPSTGEFDLDGLITSYLDVAAEIKKREGPGTESCRSALIEAGMSRARRYGWNDTYTHTKWIGEQLLVRNHGDVPVVVFRPAIIEGSYDEPAPGWIDGLRMADPIIVAYGKGKIKEFPGRQDVAIDLIPVDFVANAMIATLPGRDASTEYVPVFQCCSSGRHPCLVGKLAKPVQRAFIKRPMYDDDGKPIKIGALELVNKDEFIKRWRRRQRRVERLQRIYQALGVKGRRLRKLSAVSRQIEQVIYFAQIYSPYTHLDCRFCDDGLQAVAEGLDEADRKTFPFDPTVIDWTDYMINRHVPGLRSFVLGTGSAPDRRIRAIEDMDDHEAFTPADILSADNLFEVFAKSAERMKERPALQVKRGPRWIRYSYEDVLRTTGAVMQRLIERGRAPGDRIAICAEGSPEWGIAYLSIMRAGMTAVPLDPQLPPEEAMAAARFAKAEMMLISPGKHKAFKAARKSSDPPVVLLKEPFVPPPGASRDVAPKPEPVGPDQPASILFTSGTTVAAKAVPLTHRNLIANARALLQVHRLYSTDELLSVLPMYHAFEFTGGFLCPLVAGATITYVSDLKGTEIRAAMKATGTTVMLVVPRLLHSFLDAMEMQAGTSMMRRGYLRVAGFISDVSGRRLGKWLFRPVHKAFGGHLRMFVSGGSALEPAACRSFERMGFPVYEGYGLTETSPVVSVNPPGHNKPGTVGKVLPNVELEIRHQNLEGIGEIWVKGPSIMSGYLDNDEATREVMVDGWFNTGDLGVLDEHGFLTITGRSKDLIVTAAGKNVYPDEVEWRYRELPYMREICVFGMAAKEGVGDAVHAVIVIDEDAAAGMDISSVEREIRMAAEVVSAELPAHQRISSLHFWRRELPRTSTMKAKRGLVRDEVLRTWDDARGQVAPEPSGSGAEPAAHERVTLPELCKILSRLSRRPADSIDRNAHLLLDLGIDSIGKIDVIGAIEARFAMEIDDETASNAARVSDLLAIIGERHPVAGGRRDPSHWRKRLAVERGRPQATNGHLPGPLLPIRWALRGSVGVFMNTYVRVRARGAENLPASGPFILAPNHSSHLDSPSVLQAVGGRRRVWVAGAQDYFFNTRLKRFIFGKVLDTIPFDRKSDGVKGLRRCGDALTRGDGLLIFPEGTRSTSGEMQPFKTGVAVLAIERNVPVVPVHIDRAFDLFPKGAKFVHPGTVTVTFGKPIHPRRPEEIEDHYEAFHELTQRIEDAVSKLRDGVAS